MNDSLRHRLPELLPQLWRFALRLTGDAGAAKTLVQSSCRQALQFGPHPSPDSDPRRQLYAIMHKLWWNDFRPLQRRRGPPSAHGLAPDGSHAGAAHRQVVALVDALPDDLRSVMLLVVAEGFACHEAAEILALPVDTVTCGLARARIAIGKRRLASQEAENAPVTMPAQPGIV